jgi:hypothetical protein
MARHIPSGAGRLRLPVSTAAIHSACVSTTGSSPPGASTKPANSSPPSPGGTIRRYSGSSRPLGATSSGDRNGRLIR